jgi:cell division protein FtsL
MVFDPFSMVVAIVAISVGAGVLNNYFKLKHANQRNANQDRELSDVKAEVAKLQDRVRVLEKLAVDGDRQLSAEINRLR